MAIEKFYESDGADTVPSVEAFLSNDDNRYRYVSIGAMTSQRIWAALSNYGFNREDDLEFRSQMHALGNRFRAAGSKDFEEIVKLHPSEVELIVRYVRQRGQLTTFSFYEEAATQLESQYSGKETIHPDMVLHPIQVEKNAIDDLQHGLMGIDRMDRQQYQGKEPYNSLLTVPLGRIVLGKPFVRNGICVVAFDNYDVQNMGGKILSAVQTGPRDTTMQRTASSFLDVSRHHFQVGGAQFPTLESSLTALVRAV